MYNNILYYVYCIYSYIYIYVIVGLTNLWVSGGNWNHFRPRIGTASEETTKPFSNQALG